MAEETMPVTEVQANVDDQEVAHYECAFHILPTVTEEEVPSVVDALTKLITTAGGTITNQEAPEHVDLAYEIIKQVDGYNRRFNAAHFGWVRFTVAPSEIPELTAEIKLMPTLLRFLVVKLTRAEEAQPFSVFANRRARASVEAEEEGDIEISTEENTEEEKKDAE